MSADKNDVEKVEECKNPLVDGKTPGNNGNSSGKKRNKIYIIIFILVLLLLCTTIAAVVLALRESKCNMEKSSGEPENFVSNSKGTVVSDHADCSQVGRDIFAKNGTAVDAAIATLICNGVLTPHSMGIGGGCFMVIYDKKAQKSIFIDGREMGPHGMTAEYFYSAKKNNARRIGIPGELKAYKKAHNTYGQLPWNSLFQPTLDIMMDSMVIREATYKAMVTMNERLKPMNMSLANFSSICEIFCSDPKTGEPKKTGEKYHWPKMRETLKGVAEHGPDYLYNGPITATIVKELQAKGSKISLTDFTSGYDVVSGPSLKVDYRDYTMYTMGRATGGPVVAEVLNVLEGYNLTKASVATCQTRADTYHKMIEAMKFGDADKQHLEDPDFGGNIDELIKKMVSKDLAKQIRDKITPETHNDTYYTSLREPSKMDDMGTSHVSVLGPNGDAVSVTSTINWYFGAMEMSESTGILWNNEMDDFSSKTASANVYAPGKRPRSSMVPAIIVDKQGNVRFVVGASGGVRITTSVAQITAKMLWIEDSLRKVINEKRFHYQINKSQELELENGFAEELECVKDDLVARNHNLTKQRNQYISVVESIYVHKNGTIEGVADKRKLHLPY